MDGSGKGFILDIQRMSTEDGPGLRTTVFFKGCNLKCAWCHNPESITFKRLPMWLENRCIRCDSCLKMCGNDALELSGASIVIDRDRCKSCLACISECPAAALEARGEEWEAGLLVNEVLKDRVYFEKSGGGVTVSGGEALLQPDFIREFFRRLKESGIHTALDTAGNVPFELLERVLPFTDLILFDIKLMDPVRHKRFTGCDNSLILENAARLAVFIKKCNGEKGFWIRTPTIPDATTDECNIRALGEFISGELGDVVEKWELCAFNNLCRDKYKRIGENWMFKDTPLLTREDMEKVRDIAVSSGVPADKVCWSGPVSVDKDM